MLHKLKSHTEKIRKNSKAAIILGLIIVLGLIVFFMLRKTQIFEIEDKCGKFVNLVSHTIEDESKCRTRCRGQCEAEDLSYAKIEFSEVLSGCNKCTCYCR